MTTPFISKGRIEKQRARMIEDVEFALKMEGLQLAVTALDPEGKAATLKGAYSDFLLARKARSLQGWSLVREE